MHLLDRKTRQDDWQLFSEVRQPIKFLRLWQQIRPLANTSALLWRITYTFVFLFLQPQARRPVAFTIWQRVLIREYCFMRHCFNKLSQPKDSKRIKVSLDPIEFVGLFWFCWSKRIVHITFGLIGLLFLTGGLVSFLHLVHSDTGLQGRRRVLILTVD